MTESIGVIFATTGKDYTQLAERAARSVKENCPGLEIDIFTDHAFDMPVFNCIHQLEDPWRRSKIDAMAESRFDKTLYLDADIFVVADIRDVFEVLDRFDLAMAHDPIRNGERCHTFWRKPLPNGFPQFNSGVVAYRKSPEVTDLIKTWSVAVRNNDFKRDQPVLRELLWDSDLRIATLPAEYNFMKLGELRRWKTDSSAPRIIHNTKLHKHFTGNKRRIESLDDLLGPLTKSKLPILLSADRSLARMAGREPHFPSGKEIWLRRLRLIRDIPRHWFRRFW